ncbi:MAG: hypothetical protein HQM15_01270 [Deltaproteobacteria bacterium]|nr:hypothetical protein [Deltaproteobacteria bacterium]
MKLFAQHGSQEGEKINEGISQKLIDGVIYSPRDVSFEKLEKKIQDISKSSPSIELYFDPQFYASFLIKQDGAKLGYLEDDYTEYFQHTRRSQLERESEVVNIISLALQFQKKLNLTAYIAPNILIHRSFDSIEASISKDFIRQAAEVHHTKIKDNKPLYVTLAVSREALTDKNDFFEFLNEVTMLETPPSGFYLLVAARSNEARSDIYNPDVIAAWMMLNHTLKLNGFEVINGYSDILTPFLGIAGGSAGATGWWSNLRNFSIDRFNPLNSGGRLPIQRYLSINLLNRITHFELSALKGKVPSIINGLETDKIYQQDEPARNQEVLQSWQSLKKLNGMLASGTQIEGLKAMKQLINKAKETYDQIKAVPSALDTKSNDEHLEPLEEALRLFRKHAEIDFPTN